MKKYFVVMINVCAPIQGSDFFKNELPQSDQKELAACFLKHKPQAIRLFNALVDRHLKRADFAVLVIREARRQYNNEERAILLLQEVANKNLLLDEALFLRNQETALDVVWWQGLPQVCAWLIKNTKPSRTVLEKVQGKSNFYLFSQYLHVRIIPELSKEQKALRDAREACIELIKKRLAEIDETGAVYSGSSCSLRSLPSSSSSQPNSTTSSATCTPFTPSVTSTPFSGTPGRLPSVTFQDDHSDSE